jgi:hypothetical protein
MKKWNIIRILGFLAALILITFGSFDNVRRSLKLAGERIKRIKE